MTLHDQLRQALNNLKDPKTKQLLSETNGLVHLGIDEEESVVTAIIAISEVGGAEEKQLSREIAKVVKLDFKFRGIKLQFEPLKSTQSDAMSTKKSPIYLAITSGKGGVGKSTVTANLAVAMTRLGHKVGIIDADIYGPSIPHLFEMNFNGFEVEANNLIIPPTALNIPIISSEFFLDNNEPLMWRGPMLNRMLNHFFNDVSWSDELDFMLIDLPPGTGDVAMDIQKLIPEAHVIVVTTPHQAASHIAIKSGYMAQKLNHNILGVVENMAYYLNPASGQQDFIFGSGGGELVAQKLNTDVLTSLPIGQPTASDSLAIYSTQEEAGILFLGLANKLVKKLT